jgi:hypothetical protein
MAIMSTIEVDGPDDVLESPRKRGRSRDRGGG